MHLLKLFPCPICSHSSINSFDVFLKRTLSRKCNFHPSALEKHVRQLLNSHAFKHNNMFSPTTTTIIEKKKKKRRERERPRQSWRVDQLSLRRARQPGPGSCSSGLEKRAARRNGERGHTQLCLISSVGMLKLKLLC